MAAIRATFPEPVLVSGHSHLQFARSVAGLRNVNPGSVGLPYHDGPPGTAYWALLGPGPDLALRATRYDVADAVARGHRSGDPAAERMSSLLTAPPTVAEVSSHAKVLGFAYPGIDTCRLPTPSPL